MDEEMKGTLFTVIRALYLLYIILRYPGVRGPYYFINLLVPWKGPKNNTILTLKK